MYAVYSRTMTPIDVLPVGRTFVVKGTYIDRSVFRKLLTVG